MTTLYSEAKIFVGTGAILSDHNVLVENDRITKVAPTSEFEGFAGRTVNLAGTTILPGLTDCHVHLCLPANADPQGLIAKLSDAEITMMALKNAQETLRGGITSIRDCGGRNYLEFAVRDAINRYEFIGPTIHASGKMICMTGGHGNTWGRVADGCDEVIKAVREQVYAGSDLIKIMATGGIMTRGVNPEDAHYSADEMRAGVQEATRFHKRTASHAQGSEGILNAVRAGITSIEHGILMTPQCLEEMIEGEIYLVPTIIALQNVLKNKDYGVPAFMLEKTQRIAAAHIESFKAFYKAGGKIAMGTDAGTPFNTHGNNVHELEFMVKYGMSPKKMPLLSATFNGADLMGDYRSGNN